MNETAMKWVRLGGRCWRRLLSHPIKWITHIDDNKVVFTAYSGHGYACNPKYILEELHREAPDVECVWLTAGHDATIPKYVRQVEYGTLSAVKELATAKVWVDNTRGEKCVSKRPSQFYIQTWHGFCGPKKVEQDAGNMSPLYHVIARWDAKDTDLMFADNAWSKSLYERSFWYDGDVIRCGFPRNKPFLVKEYGDAVRRRVRQALRMDDGTLLVLYAPTFRKGYENPAFSLDYDKVRKAIERRFSKKAVIAVRLHPNDRDKASGLPSDVLNLSTYPDGEELIASSDIVITDFSSVAEDFILTGQPGFMYIPDYDKYLSEERGMYYPVTRRPFPLAKSQDELINAIEGFSDDGYEQRRQDFLDWIGFEDDGHGDETIAHIVLEHLNER